MKTWNQQTGTSAPLGAEVRPDGVNFSVFSKYATAIDLLLFDDVGAAQPSRVVHLDSAAHRTYHYWHVFVPDLRPGQIYAYRVQGPFAPERGLRFDPAKVLLDPYGLGVAAPRPAVPARVVVGTIAVAFAVGLVVLAVVPDQGRCVDTASTSTDDVQPWNSAPAVPNGRYLVPARTFVLLAARLSPDAPSARVE
jgi:hypothetical protein